MAGLDRAVHLFSAATHRLRASRLAGAAEIWNLSHLRCNKAWSVERVRSVQRQWTPKCGGWRVERRGEEGVGPGTRRREQGGGIRAHTFSAAPDSSRLRGIFMLVIE